MTFDLDQTVADLRDLFNSDQYPADDDLAVARFTADRALRAYGCPDETASTIAAMIYWASRNVAHQSIEAALGFSSPMPRYDILAQARTTGQQVAA